MLYKDLSRFNTMVVVPDPETDIGIIDSLDMSMLSLAIWYNVSSVQNPFSLMIAGEYTKGLLIQYIRDYHNQLGNPFLSNQCKGTLRVL